ncbi:MAG: hypothetical protein J6Q22_10605 [Prevotella sp.]|nr:hypothetical protein [Prevotella sp.]
MKRRRPRIISRAVEDRKGKSLPIDYILPPLAPRPQKTDADRLYDLIHEKSVIGYRFTDNEYGIPWIERGDIEYKGDNIYVIRFRCPVDSMHDLYFGRMAEDVCHELKSRIYLIHNTKSEYGIMFEDCIWVIQKDELLHSDETAEDEDYDGGDSIDSQEEIEGELTDDSTAEEIDERFERTLEVFV